MFLPKPDAHGIIRFDDGFVVDWNKALEVCLAAYNALINDSHLHGHINRSFEAPQLRFIPKGVKKGSYLHVLWLFFTALTDRREVSSRVYESGVHLFENARWIYGPGKKATKKAIADYISRLTSVSAPVTMAINARQGLLFDSEQPSDNESRSVAGLVEKLVASDPNIEEVVVVGYNKWNVIETILRGRKVGAPGQSARYWPRVAKTLYEHFNGDPLEIFRRYPSVEAFLGFKKEWARKYGDDPFPGIGAKIYSLIAMFYAELGLIEELKDGIPVDVHLQRFALATGMIWHEGSGRLTNEMLERKLRPLYCQICKIFSWSHTELSHALWFLGKHLCSTCHKSKMSEALCPVFHRCKGPISSNSYFRRGTWIIHHLPKNGGHSNLANL